jgi:cyclopropane-fatty-acyl-phospholipid synthase
MGPLVVSRKLYDLLSGMSDAPAPAVLTWTGERWGSDDAAATLVLRHPGAFRALLLPPSDLSAGEAYVYDDVDVQGDMIALLEFTAGLRRPSWRSLAGARVLWLARRLPSGARRAAAEHPAVPARPRTAGDDRQAVTYHYDMGNDFFALYLDPAMVYSCAHFLDPGESLEVAQLRKLDLICRKLELSPGQRFLDVGCGWGALVIHAASHYGVEATGVTLSDAQADLAEQRVQELGLQDRVTIVRGDYRELAGSYDAIASVGMFEHVGRARLSSYFSTLRGMLSPGGRLLNHGIVTRDRVRRRRRLRPTFISTYVFPGGELVPVDEVVRCAEDAGFELRDAESLRPSYALTLRRWVANLEASADEAVRLAGERIYRIWRLYMAGSAVAFERAGISVYQLLLTEPGDRWTLGRRHLVASDDA